MSGALVAQFSDFPVPLVVSAEVSSTLLETGTPVSYAFLGHRCRVQGPFLQGPKFRRTHLDSDGPVSRTLSWLSEFGRTTSGSLTCTLEAKPWTFSPRERSRVLEAAYEAAINYLSRIRRTTDLSGLLMGDRLKSVVNDYLRTAALLASICVSQGVDTLFAYQGNWLHPHAVMTLGALWSLETNSFGEVDDRSYWIHRGSHYWLSNHENTGGVGSLETWNGLPSPSRVDSVLFFDRLRSLSPSSRGVGNAPAVDFTASAQLLRQSNLVTFFTSSEDESFGMREWESPFGSQIDFFELMVDRCKHLGLLPIVRVHPNALSKSRGDRSQWADLHRRYPGNVLLPDDPISSYRLGEASSRVIVRNSTIGIELAFLGSDVGTIAPARYGDSGAVLPLRSTSELDRFLRLGSEVKKEIRVESARNYALTQLSTEFLRTRTRFSGGDKSDLLSDLTLHPRRRVQRLPLKSLRRYGRW